MNINFLRIRKRLVSSIILFFLGVGLSGYSIIYSLHNMNGGLNAVFNMFFFMITGYICTFFSQIFLFAEVWKLGPIISAITSEEATKRMNEK